MDQGKAREFDRGPECARNHARLDPAKVFKTKLKNQDLMPAKMAKTNPGALKMFTKSFSFTNLKGNKALTLIHLLCLLYWWAPMVGAHDDESPGIFPGVSRELQTFCSARPSLPIDLASMVVHIKRNTSFNYKLYLFSGDDYVFQTGQIVPRDDFRVHSFPVRMKKLKEFWPADVATFREIKGQNNRPKLEPLLSSAFNLGRFLEPVPLEPEQEGLRSESTRAERVERLADDAEQRQQPQVASAYLRVPFDVHGEPLPGDPGSSHDVALVPDAADPNRHIEFDRDDQVAPLARRSAPLADRMAEAKDALGMAEAAVASSERPARGQRAQLRPVGAFSSFHVNSTYLVRKDFGQTSSEVVRLLIEPNKFQLLELHLVSPAPQAASNATEHQHLSLGTADELSFLEHKMLRDKRTRITAINQIYEDWITRNFYTVVYIQRQLHDSRELDESDAGGAATNSETPWLIERLVFRGSSSHLLGADQLDYPVKASAFITEKNGLHYYLEFLARQQKFYLGAIDWSKRPFKTIDPQRLPIKQTRTLYDNEELLLCPPSICHSEQPVDELVAYGRLPLTDQAQMEARILAASSSGAPGDQDEAGSDLARLLSLPSAEKEVLAEQPISLDRLVQEMQLGADSLQPRLHLRDWTWNLERRVRKLTSANNESNADEGGQRQQFLWRFDSAKRNELKANKDSYGFALSGHEVEASYRVFNELYLVSANQLISVNYTLANETVISSRPIAQEFPGLTSSLMDPITGAFYERQANQLYFFKGDRYVGFDYASRRPLRDFQLPAGNYAYEEHARDGDESASLVSTLPVVAILGRQHHVDAIYHDQLDDQVYVFTGMKFYSYAASKFKNGAFVAGGNKAAALPPMRCINKHFLLGCQFDSIYPNPCHDDQGERSTTTRGVSSKSAKLTAEGRPSSSKQLEANRFSQEQQTRLRSIATGRPGGLLDFLLESTLVAQGLGPLLESGPPPNESQPFTSMFFGLGESSRGWAQERLVLCLLFAMVSITVLVTVAMICVIFRWAKMNQDGEEGTRKQRIAGADYPLQLNYFNDGHEPLTLTNRQLPPRIQQVLMNNQQQQLHYATGLLSKSANAQPARPPSSHRLESIWQRLASPEPTISQFSATDFEARPYAGQPYFQASNSVGQHHQGPLPPKPSALSQNSHRQRSPTKRDKVQGRNSIIDSSAL